eukprot:TRINITY_DN21382_c1_g1_i1.p1 TRINITY_DN21382_c1_g1~~TRINITY_DN21382_c1_g1_i1.p1  ORF type:complete len:586 (+),score=155.58 TRINITY_DN21382_c1_g1_i1:74-1759(+)
MPQPGGAALGDLRAGCTVAVVGLRQGEVENGTEGVVDGFTKQGRVAVRLAGGRRVGLLPRNLRLVAAAAPPQAPSAAPSCEAAPAAPAPRSPLLWARHRRWAGGRLHQGAAVRVDAAPAVVLGQYQGADPLLARHWWVEPRGRSGAAAPPLPLLRGEWELQAEPRREVYLHRRLPQGGVLTHRAAPAADATAGEVAAEALTAAGPAEGEHWLARDQCASPGSGAELPAGAPFWDAVAPQADLWLCPRPAAPSKPSDPPAPAAGGSSEGDVPAQLLALLRAATELTNLNRLADAVSIHNGLAELPQYSDVVEVHRSAEYTFSAAGQWEAAAAHGERVAALTEEAGETPQPNDLLRWGAALLEVRPAEAVHVLERALEAAHGDAPLQSAARAQLGRALWRCGRRDEAEKAWKAQMKECLGVARTGADCIAHAGLSEAALERGDHVAALREALQGWVTCEPAAQEGPHVHITRAAFARALSATPDAVDKLLADFPPLARSGQMLCRAASAALLEGAAGPAAQLYKAALAADPGDAAATRGLGEAQRLMAPAGDRFEPSADPVHQ